MEKRERQKGGEFLKGRKEWKELQERRQKEKREEEEKVKKN